MFGYLIQAVINAAAMLVVLLVFAWILVQAGFVNIDITMAKLFEDDDEENEECWEDDEECDCRPDDPEPNNEVVDEELPKDEVVSDEVVSDDEEEVRESEKEA